jgi:hypothetical protein
MLPLDQKATPIVNEEGFTIIVGVAVLKDRAHDRAKDRGLGKARARLGSRGLHDRKRLIDGGSGLGSDRLGWVHDRKRLIDVGSGSRSDRIGCRARSEMLGIGQKASITTPGRQGMAGHGLGGQGRAEQGGEPRSGGGHYLFVTITTP